MKPSTELFQLIKSLSKSEKRYFKLSSSLQSGEKNYMKLFDAIELQSAYDEAAIKEMFKEETFINHLPSEKNHLYSLILKSLRGFYSDNSAASILQEQLRNIELLFNKALYKECVKIIKKAKKLAYGYEKFYFLLDLIDWEKKLIEEDYHRGNFDQDLTKLVEEEEECVEKLRNLAEYQILYSKINYAFRKGGYARNVDEKKIVEEISNYHLIKGKNTAISTKAATACYYIKGLCATTERNMKDSFTNFSKVVKIMEDNPMIMKELPKRYIKALNNVMFAYMDFFEWEKCQNYIDKLKDLKSKQAFGAVDLQLKLFTFSNNAELVLCNIKGDFDKALSSTIPTILEGLEQYNGKINKEEEMLFHYNISITNTYKGDYKNALKYINLVLNDNELSLRQDVYTFARLINLIIHYELGNFDLMDYTIKSTNRFVKKNQRNYQFETVFLKNIKRLIKAKSPEDLSNMFKEFKDNIDEVLKDPYEAIATEYFNFTAWLDSKIEKKPVSEIIRSNIAKKELA